MWRAPFKRKLLQQRTIKGLKFEIPQSTVKSKVKNQNPSAKFGPIKQHYVPFWSFQVQGEVQCVVTGVKNGDTFASNIPFNFSTSTRFNFYASEKFDRDVMESLVAENPQFYGVEKLKKLPNIEIDLYTIDEETSWSVMYPEVQKLIFKEARQRALQENIKNPLVRQVNFQRSGNMFYCAVYQVEFTEKDGKKVEITYVNGHSGVIKSKDTSLIFLILIAVVTLGLMLDPSIQIVNKTWTLAFQMFVLGVCGWELFKWFPKWRRARRIKFDRSAALARAEQERYEKKAAKRQRQNSEYWYNHARSSTSSTDSQQSSRYSSSSNSWQYRNTNSQYQQDHGNTENSNSTESQGRSQSSGKESSTKSSGSSTSSTYKSSRTSAGSDSQRSGNASSSTGSTGSTSGEKSYDSSQKSQQSTADQKFGKSTKKKENQKAFDFMSWSDHQLLELKAGVNHPQAEIKRAFLVQAKRWHPDLCRNPDEMSYYNTRFKAINQAYMRLKK